MGQTRLPATRPDMLGPEHQEEVRFLSFSGGRDRSLPAAMIPESRCWELQNFYYPKERAIPRTRPGLLQYSGKNANSGDRMPGNIVAATVYQTSAGVSCPVCACLNTGGTALELWYVNASGEDKKIGDLAAANVVPPRFATFGGCLYIAQENEYIKEWQGITSTTSAAARATRTFTVADWRHILPPTWAESYNYSAGDFVVPTVVNDFYYEVTTDAGSSDAAEPAWPTNPGATVVDGGITWTCRAPGNTLTIAGDTYTFVDAASLRFDITKGSSNDALAANIRAAINLSSNHVIATGATDAVIVTARRLGVAGDSLVVADNTQGALSGAVGSLAGGVDGIGLDQINTYGAPKPSIIISDNNQRLVVADDKVAGQQDTVSFSGAANAWEWGIGTLRAGVQIVIGFGAGNRFTALAPFIDMILAHKGGQNQDIYRLFVSDPDPTNWHVTMFSGHLAACNANCVSSAASKSLALDQQTLRIFSATDTYEAISANSGVEAMRVADLLEHVSKGTAFMVTDTLNMFTVIFPAAGADCVVYNPASGRWMNWQFAGAVGTGITITCGAWSEALGKVLLGAGKFLCALDPGTYTDLGYQFIQTITGSAIGGQDASETIILGTILDYQILKQAQVSVGYTNDLETYSVLGEFLTPVPGALFVPDSYFENAGGVDISPLLYSKQFARSVNTQQGVGAVLLPMIKVQNGALAINSLTMRLATKGREA